MPPSRKKNKGRERREKKEKAAIAAIDGGGPNCTHGFDKSLKGSDCRRFMADLSEIMVGKMQKQELGFRVHPNYRMLNATVAAMDEVLTEKHPEVVQDAEYRGVIASELLSDGVNFLLNPSPSHERMACGLAIALVYLRSYDTHDTPLAAALDDTRDKEAVMRERDATLGCERGLVEWYRERIPCTCLENKWEQVRHQRRTGLCPECHERKPRSTFLICTGCKTQQCCSKACAAAYWPEHKEFCKGFWR